MSAIIYLLTNTVNGKQYVGQTSVGLEERWKTHCSSAKRGANYLLSRAIRKYGVDAFVREILEPTTLEEVNKREAYWITKLKTKEIGYNMTDGGDGIKGLKHSEETIAKLSGKNNHRYGTTHTDEHKKYLSNIMKGRRVTEAQIIKLKKCFGHNLIVDSKTFYSKNDAALYLCKTYGFSRNTALRYIAKGIVDFSEFLGKYNNFNAYTGKILQQWHLAQVILQVDTNIVCVENK